MSDPFATRRAAVVAEFDRAAQAVFQSFPEYRSATLAVGQYWNDEAADAVHETLLWSRDETPGWPHDCEYGAGTGDEDSGTVCSWCAGHWTWETAPRLSWDDNGEAIDLFAAFCKPDCHQEMDPGEAYTPYAVARAGRPVEIVGEVLQPDWIAGPVTLAEDEELAALLGEVYAAPGDDLPRQVLADWLQDHDDPRGEFIAAQLAGGTGPGPYIDPLFPPAEVCEAIEYARGFPSRVELDFEDRQAVIRHGGHPAWATVETVRFVGGMEVITDAMSAVRRVEGVSSRGVWQVGRASAPIAELHVRLDWFWAINGLRWISERGLDRLELEFEDAALREIERVQTDQIDWRIEVGTVVVTLPNQGRRTLAQRFTRQGRSPLPMLRRIIHAEEWIEG